MAHLTKPTADSVMKRYNDRIHDYCYWSHEEVTALVQEVETLRSKVNGGKAITEANIKHMVNRFLSWKLPEHFNPDNGISFDPVMNKGYQFESRREPVGTNLFSSDQADVMVRYMVEGMEGQHGEIQKTGTTG